MGECSVHQLQIHLLLTTIAARMSTLFGRVCACECPSEAVMPDNRHVITEAMLELVDRVPDSQMCVLTLSAHLHLHVVLPRAALLILV